MQGPVPPGITQPVQAGSESRSLFKPEANTSSQPPRSPFSRGTVTSDSPPAVLRPCLGIGPPDACSLSACVVDNTRRRTFRTWSSVHAFLPSFVSTVICRSAVMPSVRRESCVPKQGSLRCLAPAPILGGTDARSLSTRERECLLPACSNPGRNARTRNTRRGTSSIGVHCWASSASPSQRAAPSTTRQACQGRIGRVMWRGPRACGQLACFPSADATVPSTKTAPSACAGSLTQTR